MAESLTVDSKSRQDFYIARRPGYYPALSGVYRPMGADGFIQWKERRGHVPQDQLADWEKTFLAAQIVEWSLNLPITLQTVSSIRGEVFARLCEICILELPSDPKPSDSKPPESGAEIEKKENAG